ncbi:MULTISPECIES: hypothetical protein [Anaeromyxobacter]|uniref:hypothetical protein n=1 Tax=Anaeromyxobacter TaxID=161492 RepID=UPI001F59E94C|nr:MULTISPECIES: hypothetical protein [unclassified Anaeromyxobacter]
MAIWLRISTERQKIDSQRNAAERYIRVPAAVERASENLERLGKTEAAAALVAIEKEQVERDRAEREVIR